ncbi:hypothetical protein A2U01_0063213, partial [Trifolium medium]|nr:hypothetical protein [Trifolium medium]
KEKATKTTVTGNVSDDNTVVLSQSDENLKTVSEDIESDGGEKNKVADENVIDVDNLISEESPAEKTIVPNISKRLRSKSDKVVITDDKTPKTTRKTG